MLKYATLLACLALPALAMAEDVTHPVRPERETQTWLTLQASNREASKVPQVQTEKERDQAMQRWLDSYKYAIPDFYRWSKINSSNN